MIVGWSRGDSVSRVHQGRCGRVNRPVWPLDITYKHCKICTVELTGKVKRKIPLSPVK